MSLFEKLSKFQRLNAYALKYNREFETITKSKGGDLK